MKVYTKTGDKGTTSLIGGKRTTKDDVRVEAYGTVDELMANIALLRDKMALSESNLDEFQKDLTISLSTLMSLSALLAIDTSMEKKVADISDKTINYIESRIDTIENSLTPIEKFTIPGGHVLISLSHVCRTVCRRAERRAVSAAAEFPISESAIVYLNRLSDYLYVLGRKLNVIFQIKEELWIVEK